MKEYFCDECGAIIKSDKTKNIRCPKCGCYCCFENTKEGRAESISELTKYENEIEIDQED